MGAGWKQFVSFGLGVVFVAACVEASARGQDAPAAVVEPGSDAGLPLSGGASLQVQDPSPGPAAQDTRSATRGGLPDKIKPTDSADPDNQAGKQSKRILWIIPNYRSVSVDAHLPPLDFKGKLWLATEDTFDYSDFIFVAGLTGIAEGENSEPALGGGARGFGRYYWRIFVDSAIENYMTEALVPAATQEDPRYYTLGRGGFLKRTGYAVSRLFVTRTDSGGNTFNISEVVGAGAAAGLGNLYYPQQSNPFVKTYQRWGTQVALDGVFNILKEFWPDIDQKVFHGKY